MTTPFPEHGSDITPRHVPELRQPGRFTRVRRTRPFWGSLTLFLGAYFVGRPVLGGSFDFYTTTGPSTIIPLVLAFGMCAAAGVALAIPAQRHFPALIAIVLSIASLPLANLGGWIIGMVLGVTGSSMIFAWTPYTDRQIERSHARAHRRAERRRTRRAPSPGHAA